MDGRMVRWREGRKEGKRGEREEQCLTMVEHVASDFDSLRQRAKTR